MSGSLERATLSLRGMTSCISAFNIVAEIDIEHSRSELYVPRVAAVLHYLFVHLYDHKTSVA